MSQQLVRSFGAGANIFAPPGGAHGAQPQQTQADASDVVLATAQAGGAMPLTPAQQAAAASRTAGGNQQRNDAAHASSAGRGAQPGPVVIPGTTDVRTGAPAGQSTAGGMMSSPLVKLLVVAALAFGGYKMFYKKSGAATP